MTTWKSSAPTASPTRAIIREQGVAGLYSHTLFDYGPRVLAKISQGLELGRSFVQPQYQTRHSLDYLWYGIGAYIKANPHIRYLFGPGVHQPLLRHGVHGAPRLLLRHPLQRRRPGCNPSHALRDPTGSRRHAARRVHRRRRREDMKSLRRASPRRACPYPRFTNTTRKPRRRMGSRSRRSTSTATSVTALTASSSPIFTS
jgi:hypothetical protein